MKILHVIDRIEKAAGTTTFCVRVAEALAALGHEVAILVHHENPACDAVPQNGVRVVKYYAGVSLPFKPDVAHFHGIWPPWQHGVQRVMEKKQIPIVLSPHGMLAPWAMAHKRWKKLIPWFLYQKRDIAHAQLLVTTAKLESTWVRERGFKAPIVEIPLGTDVDATQALATHSHPSKFLAFVGRIYPVKGLDLLLKAWALLKVKLKDWHLLLIGPDQAGYKGELVALAKSLNLSVASGDGMAAEGVDVTFSGPLYHEAKTQALLASRGLILPSYTENFGGVVIDALALGLPVLASKATPWEVLAERGCGAQFELTPESLCDALLKFIVLSDEERQAMGARGHQLVVEKYTWPSIGKQMAEAYARLINYEF